jgi:hypothetical protein
MTTTPTEPTRLRDALRDSGLATLAMVLVVGVAVAGWSASFISLHQFAMAHMGLSKRPAWLVPSTFDGAALGLSLLSFRAAIFGRPSLGSALYVYGFTGLSAWINWTHISDRAGGKFVSALLPIAAVIVFAKVLKEAREAFERRHGKQIFRVRPGLLVLRWMADRRGTRGAIRTQILAIPVEALIGLGAGALAREATEAIEAKQGAVADAEVDTEVDNSAADAIEAEQVALVDAADPITAEVDTEVDAEVDERNPETAKALILAGWFAGEPVASVVRKSGRSRTFVYRQYKALDEQHGPRPRVDDTGGLPLVGAVNGTAQH